MATAAAAGSAPPASLLSASSLSSSPSLSTASASGLPSSSTPPSSLSATELNGQEQAAPDSWESDNLDERLKQLQIVKPVTVTNGATGENNNSIDSINGTGTGDEQQQAMETNQLSSQQPGLATKNQSAGQPQVIDKRLELVDSFLREALANPRDRLTILRMEQDVERFIRNPNLQVMEFQPMASSYHRAAAHRVAQHYSLQTSAADAVTPSGGECTVVVARKVGELRPPAVRLVDLPLGPTSSGGSGGAPGAGAVNGGGAGAEAAPGPGGFKLAIRRRPSGGRGGAAGDGGEGGMGGSSADGADGAGVIRSVEERKEMYNRARARIFNTAQVDAVDSEESASSAEGAGGKGEAGGKQEKEGKAVGKTGAEAGGKTGAKAGADAGGKGSGKGKGSGGEEKVGADKQGLTKSSSGGRKGRNVAILRDREKEKQDPDYQRGYDRFSQRFDPGFGAQAPNPYGMQPIYAPVVTYASEFPSLSPSAPANNAAAGNRTGRGGPGGAGPARPGGPAPGPAPNVSVHGPGQSPGSVGAGSAGLIQPGFPGAGFPPGSFPPGNLPPGGLPVHFQQIPTLGPPHPLNVWRAHAAVGMMAMHGRGVMPMPGPIPGPVPGPVPGPLPGAVPGSAPGPVPYGLIQPPSSMPGSGGSPGGVGMGMTGSTATAAGRGVGPGFPPNLQRDGIMGPGAISVPGVSGSVRPDAASYGGVPKRQEVLLPEQAALIRESYARIEKDRKQHALIMYLTIFDICPEAKPLFSMVRESSEPAPVNPRLEAHATLAFTMMCEAFSNWDDPERIAKQTPFFKALGGRHLNYGIDGDDFPVSGSPLAEAHRQRPFFKALGGRHLNYGIDGDDFPVSGCGWWMMEGVWGGLYRERLGRSGLGRSEEWFGKEWFGKEWFGKEWFGKEWFGDLEAA
ncbi:unnamed protein product [Closterium sp. NIES-65]|nr:unnamed protein product [Closterium sp. NIES-65]